VTAPTTSVPRPTLSSLLDDASPIGSIVLSGATMAGEGDASGVGVSADWRDWPLDRLTGADGVRVGYS
jgi:hypothetical protein